MSKLEGIFLIEIHIVNSDILAGVIYKQSRDLPKIITSIKKIGGIEIVTWVDCIFEYPTYYKGFFQSTKE